MARVHYTLTGEVYGTELTPSQLLHDACARRQRVWGIGTVGATASTLLTQRNFDMRLLDYYPLDKGAYVRLNHLGEND